jgi:hypothetical protein
MNHTVLFRNSVTRCRSPKLCRFVLLLLHHAVAVDGCADHFTHQIKGIVIRSIETIGTGGDEPGVVSGVNCCAKQSNQRSDQGSNRKDLGVWRFHDMIVVAVKCKYVGLMILWIVSIGYKWALFVLFSIPLAPVP